VHSVSLVERRLTREPGRDLGPILAAREDINERVEELQSEITDIRIAKISKERGYEKFWKWHVIYISTSLF
jgi:hypothetical protein